MTIGNSGAVGVGVGEVEIDTEPSAKLNVRELWNRRIRDSLSICEFNY